MKNILKPFSRTRPPPVVERVDGGPSEEMTEYDAHEGEPTELSNFATEGNVNAQEDNVDAQEDNINTQEDNINAKENKVNAEEDTVNVEEEDFNAQEDPVDTEKGFDENEEEQSSLDTEGFQPPREHPALQTMSEWKAISLQDSKIKFAVSISPQ